MSKKGWGEGPSPPPLSTPVHTHTTAHTQTHTFTHAHTIKCLTITFTRAEKFQKTQNIGRNVVKRQEKMRDQAAGVADLKIEGVSESWREEVGHAY